MSRGWPASRTRRSRACINDLPNVRPATRARVEQAIAQLRYSPSPAARALVTRRTRTIGLVAPGVSDYGPTSIAMHFNFAARAARYSVETVSALDRRPDGVRGGGRGAAAPAGRRDRARRRRRRGAGAGARPRPQRPGRRRGVDARGAARSSSRSTSTAARGRPCATWPSSGTPASCTSPARRDAPDADRARARAGATSSPRTGSRSSSPIVRRLVGGERLPLGVDLDVEPGIGGLRRATTTWRSACCRRCASAACACPRT